MLFKSREHVTKHVPVTATGKRYSQFSYRLSDKFLRLESADDFATKAIRRGFVAYPVTEHDRIGKQTNQVRNRTHHRSSRRMGNE